MTALTPDIAASLTLSWQAWLTLGTVLGVFLLLAATRVPADFAFMGGLALLLVTGVLTPGEAFSGFASPGMITVAILYVVVAGVQATGGLEWVTELITNNAAAALVFPIAMNTAERLAVNPLPFAICIMIAASASFITPIGYQTNLMVYGPGSYRFGDYMRFGLPLSLVVGCAAILLTPLIWPF